MMGEVGCASSGNNNQEHSFCYPGNRETTRVKSLHDSWKAAVRFAMDWKLQKPLDAKHSEQTSGQGEAKTVQLFISRWANEAQPTDHAASSAATWLKFRSVRDSVEQGKAAKCVRTFRNRISPVERNGRYVRPSLIRRPANLNELSCSFSFVIVENTHGHIPISRYFIQI